MRFAASLTTPGLGLADAEHPDVGMPGTDLLGGNSGSLQTSTDLSGSSDKFLEEAISRMVCSH
jgi:hypothetical protein